MKNKYAYNALFNVHTVVGIAISVGLYICFLAGGFALFRDTIDSWQLGTKLQYSEPIDYDRVLQKIQEEGYPLKNRSIVIQKANTPDGNILFLSRPEMGNNNVDKNVSQELISLNIEPDTYKITTKDEGSASPFLGTFLYDLHQFNQIPNLGSVIAGFIALFLLLAILTGVIVHSKKMFSNFFTFRLKASLKNLWTDAHTSLGVIGLPFQLLYAITGTTLALIGLAVLPSALVLYNGDIEQGLGNLVPIYKSAGNSNPVAIKMPKINDLVQKSMGIAQVGVSSEIVLYLTNYADDDALLMIEFQDKPNQNLENYAYVIYSLKNISVLEKQEIKETKYSGANVLNIIRKLHYASFGGYFVKAIFFLMALITCFVIKSGVMVWLTARDNEKYYKKKQFNVAIGAIYLGICSGLFPSIAFFFCLTKIVPMELPNRSDNMTYAFFGFWFLYITYSIIIKDSFKINKHALRITGVMGLIIPLLNGIQSGLWLTESFKRGYSESFFIDIGWLALGILLLFTAWSLQRIKRIKENSKKIND